MTGVYRTTRETMIILKVVASISPDEEDQRHPNLHEAVHLVVAGLQLGGQNRRRGRDLARPHRQNLPNRKAP